MEELNVVIKIAEDILKDVEKNGWTVSVHTNCLAVLRKLSELSAQSKLTKEEEN